VVVYRARMPPSLPEPELRLRRLLAQRLAGPAATSVQQVVRGVGALQAQSIRAARLAVRARSAGLTAAAVDRACDAERSVVRTWAMRGTLHMLPTEDVGWLVALLGPVFAAVGRRRRLQLGLDDETCERGLRAIAEVLAGGRPLSRAELVARLAGRGVALDPRSQAPAHLVAYAANRGLVCRGPDLDGDEPSYVLLADWAGEQRRLEPDAALAELARRYLAGHGPAGPHDLAAWSGLPVPRARHAFELVAGELDEVRAGGQRLWTLGAAATDPAGVERPNVRLLGQFDAYLLGYRGRELVLDPRFARRIQAGGGMVQPALLVDGRVLGTWRQQRRRDRLAVEVEPFEPLDRALLPAVGAEAADLGRFLGVEAAVALSEG
jgi:Winged helix DNA-binding domain